MSTSNSLPRVAQPGAQEIAPLTAEALDDGYVALLREASKRIEASVLYRRFISGTPLENAIAVWMADYALETVKAMSGQMRAALKAGQETAPLPDWRPIETAPKDEKRVLLFNPDEAMGGWAVQVGAWYEQLGGWQYEGQHTRHSNAHPPTHWMPLPAPPAALGHAGSDKEKP